MVIQRMIHQIIKKRNAKRLEIRRMILQLQPRQQRIKINRRDIRFLPQQKLLQLFFHMYRKIADLRPIAHSFKGIFQTACKIPVGFIAQIPGFKQ